MDGDGGAVGGSDAVMGRGEDGENERGGVRKRVRVVEKRVDE
jgi:hypothetical protein